MLESGIHQVADFVGPLHARAHAADRLDQMLAAEQQHHAGIGHDKIDDEAEDQPPALGEVLVEQPDRDVHARAVRGGHAHEDHPQERPGRELFRPGEGGVEDVTRDHAREDDDDDLDQQQECRNLDDRVEDMKCARRRTFQRAVAAPAQIHRDVAAGHWHFLGDGHGQGARIRHCRRVVIHNII